MVRMIKKLPLIIALLAMAGLTTSCWIFRPSSAGVRVESYPKLRIIKNSKFFDGWFEVTQVSEAVKDGFQVAQISLENQKKDCQLEYRFRWLDSDGVELLYDTALWKPTSSAARELILLNGIAPNPEVTDYILDVRMRFSSTRW